jgi:hypothetical protein
VLKRLNADIYRRFFVYNQSLKACFIKKNVRRYLFNSTLQGVGADILLYSVTARVMRVLVISKQMLVKLNLIN